MKKTLTISTILLTTILLGMVPLYGQAEWISYTTLNTGTNGIVDNKVNAILFDSNGKQWYGTDEGLSVYNGSTWTLYSADDVLDRSTILSLFEDSNGNIWVGTSYGGVSRFDGTNWTTFGTSQGLANSSVRVITEAADGLLWVGTIGGVNTYDGSTWTTIAGLPSSTGYDIIIDASDNVWAAGANGLCKFDGSTWTTYTSSDGLANTYTTTVLEDASGNIWVGTGWSGLCKFDGTTWTTYTTSDGLPGSGINHLDMDSQDNIWIATSNGVAKYNGTTFTSYTTTEGLANNSTNDIFIETSDNIWFATQSGASKYDGTTWTTLNTEDGLADNSVYTIIQDGSGDMYFGTYEGGLSKFDGSDWNTYTTANNIPNNQVYCSHKADNGDLWFGTYGGVVKYDGSTWTTFKESDGLADDYVKAITEDAFGNIWFATYGGGVSKYNGSTFTNYSTTDGLISNYSYGISADGNTIWVVSSSGASKFDGSSWTTYTTTDGLASNSLECVFVDNNSSVWFGTGYNGITKYDGATWTNYTTTEGLSGNSINNFCNDLSGNLWIATDNGATKFDGNEWTIYNVDSGLVNNIVHTVFCDNNGNMWFGTYKGVSKFGAETTPTLSADFSATTTSGNVPLTVNFTDASTGSPTSWAWTFEGGSPGVSTDQNPTGIVYNTAGTYDVTLVATNADGSDTEIKTDYITVTEAPSGITSTTTGGYWNETTTWIGGVVPTSTDDVIIDGNVLITASVTCYNITVNPEDTLRSDYFDITLTVTGSFTNNGVLLDVSNSWAFIIDIEGNMINNGTWKNNTTNLTGSTDQTITLNSIFEGANLIDTDNTSAIITGSNLSFKNTILNFNNGDLNFVSDYSLSVIGASGKISNMNINGIGNDIYLSDDAYISDSVIIDNVSFTGEVQIGNNVTANNITVTDTLRGYTVPGSSILNVTGTLTNNGYILDVWNSWAFIIDIEGNMINNGTWKNNTTNLTASTDQTITLNSIFEGANLIDTDNTSAIIAGSNLSFKNTILNFNNGDLNFVSDYSLSVIGASGKISNMNINGIGNNIYLNDDAYISDSVIIDNVSFTGEVQIGNNVTANNITVTDTLRGYNFGNILNVTGTITNNGYILDVWNSWYFIVNAEGNIINNGTWTNHEVNIKGINTQTIDLGSNSIESNVNFHTMVDGASTFQWTKNGSSIDGEINSTLNFNTLTVNEIGTYYCITDQGNSRNIIVQGELVADFSATPLSGDAPLEVTFTDASTGSPVSWSWDFDNDGTADATTQNPSHTYSNAGTYTVSLTVSDGTDSDTEIKTDYITVTEISVVDTLLCESFEGAVSGWTTIDNDGDGSTWEIYYESPPPDTVAHTGVRGIGVSYNSSGNDDWLITPQLILTEGATVTFSFWAHSHSSSFLEDFNVKLSTNSTDIADFTVTLEEVRGVPYEWTQYAYDLSAYAGQSIYLAVQCVSVDKYVLWADDFSVTASGGEIAIDGEESPLPEQFSLHQNYPNPFNPTTTIVFDIPQAAKTNITIYDITGRLIDNLVSEYKQPGRYSFVWNASNVPSGMYFVRMTAGNFNSVKKMILLK